MPLIAVLFLPPRFGINIWKATNDLQFNNSRLTTDQIAIKSISLTSEIQKAFYSDSGTDMNMYPTLIRWSFPTAGKFKINTDGSVDRWERRNFGGLARSEQGKWVESFCDNIGWATVIKIELWAIRYAREIG